MLIWDVDIDLGCSFGMSVSMWNGHSGCGYPSGMLIWDVDICLESFNLGCPAGILTLQMEFTRK